MRLAAFFWSARLVSERTATTGGKCGLESDMSPCAPSSCYRQSASRRSSFMRDRGKACHDCGLGRSQPSELRQLCDQYSCGDQANPRDGPQKPCVCCPSVPLRNDAFDPLKTCTDLAGQHGHEFRIFALGVGGDVLLPAGRDLHRKPCAHVQDMRTTCSQGPENTQILCRQPSTGIRSEQHESSVHRGIDPVFLRPRAPGKGIGLDLCR